MQKHYIWPCIFLLLLTITARGENFTRKSKTLAFSVAKVVTKEKTRDGVWKDTGSGTGFIWPDSKHFVTAYHVVAGQERIDLHFKTSGNIVYDARIVAVYKDSDLALLSFTNNDFEGTPLKIETNPSLSVEDPLFVIGSPMGMPSLYTRKIFYTDIPGPTEENRLEQLINPGTKAVLEELKYPALSAPIYPLGTGLLPGDSGAPVFNKDGLVVAIGNGGINKGTTSINWGIPAATLTKLRKSKEKPGPAMAVDIWETFWYGYSNIQVEKTISLLKREDNLLEILLEKMIEQYLATDKKYVEKLERTIEEIDKLQENEIIYLHNKLTAAKEALERKEQHIKYMLYEYSSRNIETRSSLYKEAWAYFIDGEIEKALSTLDDAKLVIIDKKDKEIAVDYILKAEILASELKFEEAEKYFQRGVEIYPDYDNCFAFALYLQRQNQYTKALPLYEKALEIVNKDREKNLPDVATTLNNLGALLYYLSRYREAEKHYTEALEIRRKLAKTNRVAYLPDVAETLNNPGIYYPI